MAIKALAHICINTKDLERSRKFYSGILGFEKVFQFTKEGKVVGFYLRINDNTFVEIFQDNTEYAPKSSLTHFCLETDNIEAMRKKLMENGIDTTPIKLGADRSYQFWFSDPNGIAIEFHQYTDNSSQKTRRDVEVNW
jgi:catechol 2,3-dioxygenase-like lactoylglutathione lyase family enzyme